MTTDTSLKAISFEDLTATPAQIPFSGRAAELASMAALLDQVQGGKGAYIGVVSESGKGKSRLAQEVAAIAKERGMTQLVISCRGSRHRAYQPFAEIVRELFAIKPLVHPTQQFERLQRALGDLSLSTLIEPLAGLLGIAGHEGGTGELHSEASFSTEETINGANVKLNPVDALLMLLGQIGSNEHGFVLVLDDLDQAHPRTITAALDLTTKLEWIAALMVITFAPDAPDNITHHFDSDHLITLSLVDRESSDAIVRAVLNVERASDNLLNLIWSKAGGDPLFTRLLVEELGLRERITFSRGEAAIDEGGRAPGTLMELVIDGVSRLTESERESLLCAAVLGDGFRSGSLSALRGNARSEDVLNDLAALETKGWLERLGEARLASYGFTNRVRQSVIYNTIPDERANTLHNNAGDYYSVAIGGRKVRAENAAYHYMKSGNAKRAIPVLEMAAQRAIAAGDPDQAQVLFELGAQAAQLEPGMSDKQIEMAEHLGDMHLTAGEYDQAVTAYTENSPTMTSPSLYSKLGLALLAVDMSRATNVLQRALALLQIGEREDLRWALEASLSWAMARSGNSYDAIRRSRDALGRLGDTVGFGWARSMMRGMLGMILFYDGEVQEALPHLESAKAGWSARGHQEGVMLVNQVLISLPADDVSKLWLKLVLPIVLKTNTP